MSNMDCIFCKISAGDIPSKVVYEDEIVFAFLDNTPFSEGHTLIIPKKHHANLMEIDSDTFLSISKVAKKLADEYVDKLGCTGFNLHNNSGRSAEQTVFHFHLHLVPRYEDDAIVFGGPSGDRPEVNLDSVYKKLTS